ncbi:RDD family protein [Neobacillus mesonae]|nr:RDD family protein [Neobacillus mesonae]
MVNEPAGFWIRFGAALLDGIIVGIPVYIISYFITGSSDESWFTELSTFLYSLLLPVFWGGYTIGKFICGIKIRKVSDEGPPGIGTMLLRDVVAGLIYGFTFGIAVLISLLMVVFREDKRSIHDFIAGTEVVRS